jgi:peptidase E
MATRYILHGGNAQDVNDENTHFFQEVLEPFDDHANVLLVQFAAISEKQSIYKQRHIAQFNRAKGKKSLSFAVADDSTFDEQLMWADVVYLCGSAGGTVRLLAILHRVFSFKEKLVGKTVAGESAGANCLSTYCFSRSSGIMHCLGIVPVNFIAHYQPGEEYSMQHLNNGLEIVTLKNYEYRTFIS